MKSTFLGLRTVIYYVSDLDKAKEWYSEALQCKPYFDQPFYVGFSVGGYELGLQPEQENGGNKKGENVRAYWGVEHVESEYKRLIEFGASEYEKPQDVGDGIIVACVKDPWGNIIGMIFNPNFKAE